VRIGAPLIGRQLHVPAPAVSALRNRPFDHLFANPAAPPRRRDSHCLDLPSPRALSREAWYETELQGADNFLPVDSNGKEVMRVDIDCSERSHIGLGAGL
jgi:hypothetical protein